jgi:hypothetical protein
MTLRFEVLDEVELLEFFGTDPVERSAEDGYWCYAVTDERGVMLRFSFNIFERSVQTVVSLGGTNIATVSHEAADRMIVRDGKLRCEFSSEDSKTTLSVETGRSLSVVWSTLSTR